MCDRDSNNMSKERQATAQNKGEKTSYSMT
jgi:hypothetical protein